ncbi:hypothetical protein SH580_03180 [Coraliomargarita algicola]|uniref:Uncharacterized protein n=1 Tax=Coraliomargarita algicola TaxID=3092156 RepID=A0ABZ0RMS6_9BACT|nr:hypothetical protein [Coraliomargarita sp. J2-16]WPJ96706.1 hypothetical protein SH580_03180 [Coraliomargarita sp. J2-16]
MHFFNRYLFKLLVGFTLCSQTLHAQEYPVINFKVYLWPTDRPTPSKVERTKGSDAQEIMRAYTPPKVAYSPNGADEVSFIQIAKKRISPSYRYQGPQPLTFFNVVENARQPLGSTRIADGMREVLLLLFPNSDESPGYQILPLDISNDTIPDGQALIYNLSEQPVACLFNKQKIALLPNTSELAKLGPEHDYAAIIRIGAQDHNGEWSEQYAQRLFIDPQGSALLMIYKQPDRGNVFRIMQIKNNR